MLSQSRFRRKDRQKDGWGIAHFNGPLAKIVKSSKDVFDEAPRFRALAAKIRSRVVIGHLRAASNPMRLSRRRLMSPENAQPFTDGRFVFAHNGTILIPREVIKFLGPYKHRLKGDNDSEIFFWQFRKFFDLYGDVPRALEACVQELWTLWDMRRTGRAKKGAPYLGLNTLVADGGSLHALCLFPPKHPKLSLFNPKVQWGRMSFARRGDRVILSSEEVDEGAWRRFRNPEIISATISGGKISLKRRKITAGPA